MSVSLLNLQANEFYNLTPFELNVMLRGYHERRQERNNDIIALAWYTEAFARQKKLPKLENLIKKTKKRTEINEKELIEIAQKKGLQIPNGRGGK